MRDDIHKQIAVMQKTVHSSICCYLNCMRGDIHKTDNSDADIEAVHVVTLNYMRGNLHKQCCDRISINILSHCVVSRANAPK